MSARHTADLSLLAALAVGFAALAVGCDYDSPVPATPDAGALAADVRADTARPPYVEPSACTDTPSPGPAPLRRLTRTEYDNTLRDLLGTPGHPGADFPPEEEALGFDNNASGRSVSQIHIERYMLAAEQVVAETLRDRRETLVFCDPDDVGAILCAEWIIERFGKRAYRRPLSEAEVIRYRDWFMGLYPDEAFEDAVGMVLEAMLQSPYFLYRLELGGEDTDGDGVVALTPYELATRMAYLLWSSTPDDLLIAAAQAGKLATVEGVADEARRLLRDPRARDASLHFHRQWLQVQRLDMVFKDDDIFPEFTPALRDRLGAETDAFVNHVIFEGEGSLTAILSAPYSMLDPALAAFYGVDPPAGGAMARVDLDPARRAGVLTHGSVLSTQAKFNQTSPVLRGKWVREQLLCDHLEPPPADVDITPPALDPNLTTRERFAQHSDDPSCIGCHRKMDPVGFSFEHYDGVGRWRDDEDGGQPVEADGELLFTDVDGEYYGVVELAQRLAGSARVHGCYITQWFRFAHGRDTTDADACTLEQLEGVFVGSDLGVQELMIALTQTDAFRFRPAVEAAGLGPSSPNDDDAPGAADE